MTEIDDIIYSPILSPIEWGHLWRDLDRKNKRAVSLILDNLKWEAQNYPDRYSRPFLNFLAELNAYVYPRLIAHHIIGVQPMIAHDRGMVARLEYDQDGDTIRLQLKTHIMDVHRRKLSERVELDPDGNTDYNQQLLEIAHDVITELDMDLLCWLRRIPDTPTEKNSFDFKLGNLSDEDRVILPIMIQRQASAIAMNTKRSKGNWAVLSPAALSVLEKAPISSYIQNHSIYEPPVFPHLVKYAGVLNGNITIFCDPYADDSTPVLVGLKGGAEIDAGVIYGPYLPIDAGGIMVDPNTFEQFMSLTTRRGCIERVESSTDTSVQRLTYSKSYFGMVGTTGTGLLDTP